jgi:hypothetical protein
MVEMLLAASSDKGAYCGLKDSCGYTALHFAAAAGDSEIVSSILAIDRALATLQAKDGYTALHIAARSWRPEIVKLLLNTSNGLFLDMKGRTALHHAEYDLSEMVSDSWLDAMSRLQYSSHFRSPQVSKKLEVIKLLIGTISNIADARDIEGETVLHKAAREGQIDTIKLLVACGANIKTRSAFQLTRFTGSHVNGTGHNSSFPRSRRVRNLEFCWKIISALKFNWRPFVTVSEYATLSGSGWIENWKGIVTMENFTDGEQTCGTSDRRILLRLNVQARPFVHGCVTQNGCNVCSARSLLTIIDLPASWSTRGKLNSAQISKYFRTIRFYRIHFG